jgi:type IV pilus biogenesis protein CpaD/CtpE
VCALAGQTQQKASHWIKPGEMAKSLTEQKVAQDEHVVEKVNRVCAETRGPVALGMAQTNACPDRCGVWHSESLENAADPDASYTCGGSSSQNLHQSAWNSRRNWEMRPGDRPNLRLTSVVRSPSIRRSTMRRSRAVRVARHAAKSNR